MKFQILAVVKVVSVLPFLSSIILNLTGVESQVEK